MKLQKLLLLLAVCAAGVFGQQFRSSSVDPSGGCTTDVVYNTTNGKLWGCQANVFVLVADANASGSGVTIDSTTITGGGDCRVLFQAAGKVSESLGLCFESGRLVSGGITPTAGPNINPNNEALILLGQSDYAEMAVAAISDGFAGAQYNWAFIAAMGDVDPQTGDPATAGSIQYLGSFWVQQEDTTENADRIDWGIDIASFGGMQNRPIAGNGLGDIGLGKVAVTFPSGMPTDVTDANMYVKGDGTLVSIKALKTTGSAGSKKVVCVDTVTGRLYASSTGTDCSD